MSHNPLKAEAPNRSSDNLIEHQLYLPPELCMDNQHLHLTVTAIANPDRYVALSIWSLQVPLGMSISFVLVS